MTSASEYVDLPVLWTHRYGRSTNPQAEVTHHVSPSYSHVRYFFRRTDVPVAERLVLRVVWICGGRLSSRFPPALLTDAEFARLVWRREVRACRWCSQLDRAGNMLHPKTLQVVRQPESHTC